MTTKEKQLESDLVRAATVLAQDLKRFEEASESLAHLEMTSEKTLQKAARLLNEIVEIEGRLSTSVQALIGALNAAREKQQAQAESTQRRARVLQDRMTEFQALLERYAALGSAANEVNRMMQELGGKNGSSLGEPSPDAAAQLEAADRRLDEVSKEAEALARQAQAQDFGDLARHADSLRQQLVTARGKLNLIKRKIAH